MELRIITNHGAAKVENALNRYAARGKDTAPAMEEIALDMLRIEGIVFHSNGRRGGGSWAHLKPDTVRKKGMVEILRTKGAKANYSEPGNDALFNSLTIKGAPGQIWKVTNRRVEFGTMVQAAGIQQTGAPRKNIPARPFLKFLPSDVVRWKRIIADYLVRL